MPLEEAEAVLVEANFTPIIEQVNRAVHTRSPSSSRPIPTSTTPERLIDQPIISADSHITEPPNTYVDHIDPDATPARLAYGDTNQVDQFFVRKLTVLDGFHACLDRTLDTTGAIHMHHHVSPPVAGGTHGGAQFGIAKLQSFQRVVQGGDTAPGHQLEELTADHQPRKLRRPVDRRDDRQLTRPLAVDQVADEPKPVAGRRDVVARV